MTDEKGKVLVRYLKEYAESQKDKIAVLDSVNRLTYSELWTKVQSFAAYLKTICGVKIGDVVITRTAQEVWYPVVYFATHLAGGVTLGLEKNVAEDVVKELCRKTDCRVLISNKPSKPECDKAGMTYIDSNRVMELASTHRNTEFELPDESATADIMFTTGTTGKSKGVCIPHKSLVNNATKLIPAFGYQKDTVIIAPGPLNHGGALRKLHITILNGSTMYILNGMLSVKEFYSAVNCGLGRIACNLPPSAVKILITLTRNELGKYADIIDFIESGSAPLPEADRLVICDALPKTRIVIQYGSTEAGGLTTYNCNQERGLAGCVGYSLPDSNVFIVDDNRTPIISDKEHTGFIASRGNAHMTGYYKEPALTAEIMDGDVIYTNDVGYFDKAGRLFITGRKDDVINVGGLKVAPLEVEDVAGKYPGVIDCICIAQKDDTLGNVPKLCVVLQHDCEFSEIAMTSYLTERLEAYKVPRCIERVDKVKRMFNGKVDRKAYR